MKQTLTEEKINPRMIAAKKFNSFGKLTPNKRTRQRTTLYYEFSFYTTDSGYFYSENEKFTIRKGTWRFTVPGTKVSSIPPYKCKTVLFSLSPDNIAENTVIENSFLNSIPPFFESRFPEEFDALCDEIPEISAGVGIGSEIAKKTALYNLLNLIRKDIIHTDNKTSCEKAIDSIKKYIEENYSSDIPLTVLGEISGYHPLYIQRTFKEKLGKTPHEYQRDIRISKARVLLYSSGLSIGEISEKCGYSSVSHFNNTFKKNTGMTPLSFRKKSEIKL